MWLFRDLIKEPQDTATLAGALGGLFTLIGTVAGAYFGIKSTQDTTDKANKKTSEEAERTREANQRAQEANEKARKASLLVNPKDSEVDVQDLL